MAEGCPQITQRQAASGATRSSLYRAQCRSPETARRGGRSTHLRQLFCLAVNGLGDGRNSHERLRHFHYPPPSPK